MAEKKAQDSSIEDLQAQVESLKAALEEAHAAAAAATAEGLEQGLESLEMLRERMQESLHDVQRRIDENPIPSALVAFGVGFLLGRLLAR
ncbi:DUF883 C-terminal domain-containing protein [Parvibaculum lavamentivorans]|nr:DUF883 C-terminal domain-containing protein [Parvibaculum lavamentivorans]